MSIQHFISLLILAISSSQILMAEELDSVSKLKTLFTTQQERRQLDKLRTTGVFETEQGNSSASVMRFEPLKVEVKGVVFREKGKPVVWVNKGNTLESNKIDNDIHVRTKYVKIKNLKVPVKVNNRSLRIKPGQVWVETDTKVKDKYQIKEPKSKTKEDVVAEVQVDNKKVSK